MAAPDRVARKATPGDRNHRRIILPPMRAWVFMRYVGGQRAAWTNKQGWEPECVVCGAPGFEGEPFARERRGVVWWYGGLIVRPIGGRFCGGLLSSRGLTMAFQGRTGVALVIKNGAAVIRWRRLSTYYLIRRMVMSPSLSVAN
jgi:hypothetical protein